MAAPSTEMAKMAIKTTAPAAAPQLAKGKKGMARKVVTNSFPAMLKPNTPFYMHDFRVNAVYMHKGEEKLREVTKQTRDDFVEQDRKQVAMATYSTLKDTGLLKGDFLYDRAALLVSLQEICKGGEITHNLTAKNAPKLFALPSIKEATAVRVTIKKASESYQVTSNDVTSKNEATHKAILSIINIATSQALFEKTDQFVVYGTGNAYLLEPEKFGFKTFDVGSNDKYGGTGLTKGARLIEGAGGAAAAITVDVKKTAFHKDFENVADKLRNCGCSDNPIEATQILSGLKAIIYYSGLPKEQQKARVMTIGRVSNTRVKDVTFEANGKKITLPQFLQSMRKTSIKNPTAFAIIDKYDDKNFFSPECLMIAPNQRVKTDNIQPVNIEKLIRESATLPDKRQRETATLAKTLDAGADNAAQAKRGITVNTSAPITVNARGLAAVLLGTGNGPLSVNGPWRQGKVAQVPLDRFQKWTVCHLNNGSEPDLAQATADALVRYARTIGYSINMTLSPVYMRLEGNGEAQMQELFTKEKQGGSQFILLICNSRIKNHGLLKYMELKHDIITEQLTSNIAQKLAQQANTGTNVVLKIVEKLGGQNNYVAKSTPDLPPWITAKGTMIVGLQMQHPSSLSGKEKEANAMPSRPVCIGWSTNAVRGASQRGATDPQQEKENTHFNSDWTYAMPKDYKDGELFFSAYKDVVLSMLRSYKKYRETIPSRIVLIRGGLPEGDYDKIRSEEVPIWEAAFKTLNAAYSPSFIIVTSNEMHSDRFYQEKIPANEKAPRQNLPSGTVIDSGVTNPALSQAFIQAHVPLQGTAKVPSYVVQHSFLNPAHKMVVTMDDIIRTVHALCFTHGVCNTPTAVPTPLYVARESMKRATELLQFWLRRSGNRDWDLEEIKKELTINAETAAIHGLRVNA
ncbi:hypothetical protein PENTCL1PPCAC_3132 [Pristionchus entomophagus]|uniref:Piwi domain-containing protein n=1 Tax=Pristionchus entomophagus TaxID=358040 RepID=A0AAV5SEG1_9BILA|nr:hypothetical protein PENTCL1PPCAC_3132 [Pristionchus entomophagus]